MKLYSAHEPAGGVRTAEAAQDIIFVKEGMSWPALFFPLLWQLWHGLWLVLIVYLLAGAAIEFSLSSLAGETIAACGAFAFALLFALEANNLRRWHLRRKGYRLVTMVAGRNLDEAEFRFFTHWLEQTRPRDGLPAVPQPAPPRPIPQPPAAGRAAPIGVFPQPGGRS